MNYSNQIAELKEKLELIDKKCQHWKSCQDGSYEFALSVEGYHKVAGQIEILEGEQNEKA